MYGSIDEQPALLILERAPFPDSPSHLAGIPSSLARLRNLGANDIYNWYMAKSGSNVEAGTSAGLADAGEGGKQKEEEFFADLKINLIYPCTEAHVKKYSKQGVRFVTETPELYRDKVRPYMLSKREQGRLNWVFNILDGKTEVEDVIYRTQPWGAEDQEEEGKEGAERRGGRGKTNEQPSASDGRTPNGCSEKVS